MGFRYWRFITTEDYDIVKVYFYATIIIYIIIYYLEAKS